MEIARKFLDRVLRLVMGVSSFLLATVTMVQVISRFIFKKPIPWGQDIVRLSFVYLVFWGGAYCVRMKEHLNIDILQTSLKGNKRLLLDQAINLLSLVFFAFLFYYGIKFMGTGHSQKAPYLPLRMSWYYLALPSAALFMLVYQLIEIIQLATGKVKPEEDAL